MGKPADRDPLERLVEDFLRRHRAGEGPTIREYVERYPALGPQIESLFPTALEMERLTLRKRQSDRSTLEEACQTALRTHRYSLGDYRVVREIGRGGMGIVYEAIQESLSRRVALKVLPGGPWCSENQLQRFQREAEVAASLHHSNIVPVFGMGRTDDVCFYVMQYVEGQSLEQFLKSMATVRNPLSHSMGEGNSLDYHRWVAHVGVQAAEALHYAHGQGTLHRDIKPANLLVDPQDAVWITDFGIAKPLGQDSLTAPDAWVGTLRYMAPEQFHGQADARTDVCGLGLTLYELLALRPAYDEVDRPTLLRRLEEEAPPVRKHQPAVPRDLETIVAKAIAREPSRRYQTAAELGDDLRRFLEDRPVKARRVGMPGRLWRWCRRHRAVASLIGIAAAAMLTAAGIGWMGYVRTAVALGQAEKATARAENNLDLALQAFRTTFANLTVPDAAWQMGYMADTPWPPSHTPSEKELQVLADILAFYGAYVAENTDSQRLRQETAHAYRQMARIHYHLGDVDAAIDDCRHAMQIYDDLRQLAEEEQPPIDLEMATVSNDMGWLLRLSGTPSQSSAALPTRALAIIPHDDSPRSLREMARAHAVLAATAIDRIRELPAELADQPDRRAEEERSLRTEAAEHYRQQLQLRQSCIERFGSSPEDLADLGFAHRRLCSVLLDSGQTAEAMAHDAESLRVLEPLHRESPTILDIGLELVKTYAMLGTPFPPPLPAADYRARLDKAERLLTTLTAENPRVPRPLTVMAWVLARRAAIAHREGKPDLALRMRREAVARQLEAAGMAPTALDYQFDLCNARGSLAVVLVQAGLKAEAREELDAAVRSADDLIRKHPGLSPQYPSLGRRLRQSLAELDTSR